MCQLPHAHPNIAPPQSMPLPHCSSLSLRRTPRACAAGLDALQRQFVRYEGCAQAVQSDSGWLATRSRLPALGPVGPATRPSSGTSGAPAATHSLHGGAAPSHGGLSAAAAGDGPGADASAQLQLGAALVSGAQEGSAPAAGLSSMQNPAAPAAGAHGCAGLQQVQMQISTAPAECCLPIKNDRKFSPHFQVQVRVQHAGQTCASCQHSLSWAAPRTVLSRCANFQLATTSMMRLPPMPGRTRRRKVTAHAPA